MQDLFLHTSLRDVLIDFLALQNKKLLESLIGKYKQANSYWAYSKGQCWETVSAIWLLYNV